MKVIIFGANGGLGQWTWKAAVEAGHEVTAYVRSPEKLHRDDPRYPSLRVAEGDVMSAEAVHAASRGSAVAINCTSPAGGNSAPEMARSIVPAAASAGVQAFYMVGGIGALWVPGTERTVLVQDWEDAAGMERYGLSSAMPREMLRNFTRGHLASMRFMAEAGHRHTFICPGLMVEGPATASRVVTLDELGGTAASQVNLGDVAAVIVGDLEGGTLLGHRVGVASA